MNNPQHLPDYDRVSIVTATVLLAYSLAAFIQLPEQALALQLPGFLFEVKFNFFTIISVLVAVLAAAGTDWIISAHPKFTQIRRWEHWVLPAFTAIVIGVPLNEIAVSGPWWIVFGLGALLFVSILIAEYVSVDPLDTRYQFAALALNVVSLGLFFFLAIALRGAGLRLYAVIPPIVIAVVLMSARSLHLRLFDHIQLAWVGSIALIIGQITVCLFYLPVRPIQFGMILLALTFALTTLAGNFEEKFQQRSLWLEPVIMFSAIFLLSFLF
jgi:hypothetical protein